MQEHFPSEWVPTIAIIHQNEYGFKISSALAKKYIARANALLDAEEKKHIVKDTVLSLKKRVNEILTECVFFDEFHTEYEHFKRKARPGNMTEKLTKKLLSLHVR